MIEWLRKNYVPIDAIGIIVAGVIAAFAAGAAYVQFTSQWRLENAIAAKGAYREFLKLSLQYPQFSRPDLLGRKFTPTEYEQYFWYVNVMSQTFEEVFAFVPEVDNWNWIAREQFRLHCGFFHGGEYLPELYSSRFQSVVSEVLAKYPEKDCYIAEFSLPEAN
ncbi:MAG: hypothetical protein ACR2O8_10315 [Rhizobiaceae bacterium]